MSDLRVFQLIDRAFEYRGHVTVSRRDGSTLVGFVYDRDYRSRQVSMFDEQAVRRIRLPIDEIADVVLTGEDAAASAHERYATSTRPEAGTARPILILVAMPLELRAVAHVLKTKRREGKGAIIRGRLAGGRATCLAVGVGGGAAHAIAVERPRLVISCGLAGALAPQLATGDVVLATGVCDDHESFATEAPLLRSVGQALAAAQLTVAKGELVCALDVAATRGEKRALARPGALAVDLESGPVARAAVHAGIPWFALRVVFDPLDLDLPEFTRAPRAGYASAAVRHALGGPGAILSLAGLGLRAWMASRSLERALHAVAPATTDVAP